jgi:hypothetical protein
VSRGIVIAQAVAGKEPHGRSNLAIYTQCTPPPPTLPRAFQNVAPAEPAYMCRRGHRRWQRGPALEASAVAVDAGKFQKAEGWRSWSRPGPGHTGLHAGRGKNFGSDMFL